MSKKDFFNNAFGKALQKALKKMGIDFDDLSEEQIEAIQDIAEGGLDVEEMMDEQWFNYSLPDYKKLAEPIAPWLQPLALFKDISDIFELCEEAEKEAAKMERQQVAKDLHHYIYAYLAFLHDSNDFTSFDIDYNFKNLFAAFRLISRFNLTELLDDVLETLRQPYAILDHIYLEGRDFVGANILHDIGKGQMDKLMEFLGQQGYIPLAKPIVFDALVLTYKYEPELRLKALHNINTYLNRCLQIGLDGGSISNVSHYAYILAMAHAKETLPLLKKIYDSLDIPCIEVDGIEDVEFIMDNPNLDISNIIPTTTDDAFQMMVENVDEDEDWDEDEEDWEEDEEDWDEDEEDWDEDEDEDEDEEDENEDEDEDEEDEDEDEDEEDWDEEEEEDEDSNYLFDTDFEIKQYQIQVTLQGTLHQMVRLLKVPSNIYLDSLAQFLLLSLQWNVTDDCWFETPKTIYTNIDIDLSQEKQKRKELGDFDTTILEELFTYGKKVTFVVKEGEMPWVFDIHLNKADHYFEDEKSYVELLQAIGPAPASSMDTMKEYENDLTEGRLLQPNIKDINKEMDYLEESML